MVHQYDIAPGNADIRERYGIVRVGVGFGRDTQWKGQSVIIGPVYFGDFVSSSGSVVSVAWTRRMIWR